MNFMTMIICLLIMALLKALVVYLNVKELENEKKYVRRRSHHHKKNSQKKNSVERV